MKVYPPNESWPDGWLGYVTLYGDPDVYELGIVKSFPAARALINRSMELEQRLRAMRASARPIDAVVAEYQDYCKQEAAHGSDNVTQ